MNTSESSIAGLIVAGHRPGELTPVEVIERNKRRRVRDLDQKFEEHFLALAKKLSKEDTERDLALYSRGIRNQMHYEGDHYGYMNRLTRRWHSKPIERSDPFYPINKFRYYSDGITTQHTQSRINALFIPSNDDDRDVAAAKFAKHLSDYQQDQILTESFLQEEGKNGQFFGTEYRLSYWDPTAGPLIDRPIYTPREDGELGEDAYVCAGCGRSGGVNELLMTTEPGQDGSFEPRCLQCGSSALSLFEVDPLDLPEVSGYEKVPVGDVVCQVVPSLQVKYDRAGGHFDRGLFVRRQFRVRHEVLEEIFDWYDHKETKGGGENERDSSVGAMDIVENSIGSGPSRGTRNSDAPRVVVEQWWFKPALYGRYRVPADVELAGGMVIPKGEEIRDYFPTGMYMLVADGEPLDYRNEDFRKHWQQTRFILVPNRTDGDGIEDMIRPQQTLNEGRSIRVAHVKMNASPPTIIRDPLKEGDWTGRPSSIAHVKGLPADRRLEQLVYQPPPRPLDPHVAGLEESSDAELQAMSKAMPASMGAADPNELGGQKTASGLKLMSDNSTALRSPELALRAEGNVASIKQWLDLFQENAVEARYVPGRGKSGEAGGKRFKGSDIEGSFLVVAKRGSWLPKSQTERQTNVSNALAVGGGIVLNPQVPAAWRQLILDEFALDVELDDFTLDTTLARKRIEAMKDKLQHAVQMAESQVMPMMAQGLDPASAQMVQQQLPELAAQLLTQMVPIMPEADTHPVHIKFYRDWLKSDEGQNAHPVHQTAALMKIREHKQGIEAEATEQQLAAMRVQQPGMEAAAAQQDAAASGEQKRTLDQKRAETEIATDAERAKMTHQAFLESGKEQ